MAFILSGGPRDMPAPPMRPRQQIVVKHGGATTMFVPQHFVRMSGRGAPHNRTALQNNNRLNRAAGGAGVVDATVTVRQQDAEAQAHVAPHEDHADVEIEVRVHDSDGDQQEAEEHFAVAQNSSSSLIVAQKTLEFHTNDKLLRALEAQRKPILQAFVANDLDAVQQHLVSVLRQLDWPHVHHDHHQAHWHASEGDAADVHRTLYVRNSMPAPGGDVQVLYSSESLKPHTRIACLCGWLLPWGTYESLITVKWRTPSSSHSGKANALKAQGGSDATEGVDERKKGACHSGRSRGRGFSMQKNAMTARVHGGSQYALWMLDDHAHADNNITQDQQSEDLYALQRAFLAQDRSNEQCNVVLVHELDQDGRELTWLETNQHVPPDTLLCANLSDFYADGC